MHVIRCINVRDALLRATHYIREYGVKEQTREGDALVAPEPVAIVYMNPKQHVLLNPARDANPFFHLMEAMWMLSGRDDSDFLDFYIKGFGERFGKDGKILDAYGQRWVWGLGYNQLTWIINMLRKDPTTRQAVLQMWGAGRDDLRAYSMKPCNLTVTFRIRDGRLNMHVFNRSNDLIWGCCGANAVHFPILQEFIALSVGIEVGEYWQISTNLHMYLRHNHLINGGDESLFKYPDPEPYGETVPLMNGMMGFTEELMEIMTFIDAMHSDKNPEIYTGNTTSSFLAGVVAPMAIAHCKFKIGDMQGAMEAMETVIADDWYTAGTQWLERRHGRR